MTRGEYTALRTERRGIYCESCRVCELGGGYCSRCKAREYVLVPHLHPTNPRVCPGALRAPIPRQFGAYRHLAGDSARRSPNRPTGG